MIYVLRRAPTDAESFLIALFIFSVLQVLLAFGLVNYSIAGVYPFDYDRVVMLPKDADQLALYLIIMGLCSLLLAAFVRLFSVNSFTKYLKMVIKDANKAFFTALLSVLFVILYVLNIDDSHFSIMDSYELMAGALEIAYNQKYSFLHKAAPGASLALIPFLYFQPSEFAAQIAIIVYSALAYIAIIYLWYKVSVYKKEESEYFYIFGLLVIINPMFVAVSRTISYEPILLLVVSLLLLKVYNITTGRYGLSDLLLTWALLAYTVAIRVNYIIVIVGPTLLVLLLYFTWSHIFVTKNVRKLVLALLYVALVGVSSLALGLLLLPEWAQHAPSMESMFNWKNLSRNLSCTLYILVSAVNTPPSRSLFRFLLIELSKLSALNIVLGLIMFSIFIRGIVDLLRRMELRFFGIYIILLILGNTLFFASYGGWQARYLCVPVLLELFVVAKVICALFINRPGRMEPTSMLKFRIFRLIKNVAAIGLILMTTLAASNSAMVVINWRAESVMMENSTQISVKELEEVFTYMSKSPGRKIVFTTYEATAVFYRYKLKANFEIFFVYEFFIRNKIEDVTIKQVLDMISWYLANNYSVFYLAGWPEIDGYRPPTSLLNFGYFYELLLSSSKHSIIEVGPETRRQSWSHTAPIYILLVIEQIYQIKN